MYPRAPLAACHSSVCVPRYGCVQMALSPPSSNRISQNTPVTAGTCAPSHSATATETNYHRQSSRRCNTGPAPRRHLTRLPAPGDKSTASLAYVSSLEERICTRRRPRSHYRSSRSTECCYNTSVVGATSCFVLVSHSVYLMLIITIIKHEFIDQTSVAV